MFDFVPQHFITYKPGMLYLEQTQQLLKYISFFPKMFRFSHIPVDVKSCTAGHHKGQRHRRAQGVKPF